MNESLLQSYNDKIRLFPALPNDATLVGRLTLAAKGGFLVTSEREGGEIKYVGIKSINRNMATVVNPWGAAQVQVRMEPDNVTVLTSSTAEFKFPTSLNAVYVVERTAKRLSRYVYSRVTGTATRGVKRLSNPPCTLGS
jgi:alpha-L-fucosidase 2